MRVCAHSSYRHGVYIFFFGVETYSSGLNKAISACPPPGSCTHNRGGGGGGGGRVCIALIGGYIYSSYYVVGSWFFHSVHVAVDRQGQGQGHFWVVLPTRAPVIYVIEFFF